MFVVHVISIYDRSVCIAVRVKHTSTYAISYLADNRIERIGRKCRSFVRFRVNDGSFGVRQGLVEEVTRRRRRHVQRRKDTDETRLLVENIAACTRPTTTARRMTSCSRKSSQRRTATQSNRNAVHGENTVKEQDRRSHSNRRSSAAVFLKCQCKRQGSGQRWQLAINRDSRERRRQEESRRCCRLSPVLCRDS
jgi:hypothetical protein